MAYTFFILALISAAAAMATASDDVRMWGWWGVPVFLGLGLCTALLGWWGIVLFAALALACRLMLPRLWSWLWGFLS